ncbi:MAG: translesion DNA synthesis-associated protein ImuA [Gammaproteobacteria bacterium]|nr:translesion DNA synthesis-associated protein ImuA [Gammaproteobacteria bacterium]
MNPQFSNTTTQWQQAGVWRGRDLATAPQGVSTGYAPLDEVLPGGGWPTHGLIEVLGDLPAASGLRLLLPTLAHLSQTRRWLAWVAPPHIPYAPALAAQGLELSRVLLIHPRRASEGLWVAEQALRSDTCSAVLLWAKEIDTPHVRRLQLAMESQGGMGVIFRPSSAAMQPSPANLRIQVSAIPGGVEVKVLKCRGAWVSGALRMDWHDVVAGPVSSAATVGDIHTHRAAQ